MSLYPLTTERPSRLLCVFAHPDDEIFCAGETLARWVAAGGEAMVLSATRGEAGQIQDARVATRRTLGAVREQELREACAQLGVQHVECLDYGDGGLNEVGEERLARVVAARIYDFAPDVVVTFGPDGGYGHPDHIAISAATTRACRLIARAGGRAPQLYYSQFPRQRRLICHETARWLAGHGEHRFQGSPEFVRALTLLAEEAAMLRYADDTVTTEWFPAGFAVVEQGEVGTKLYLIISGHAEIVQEDAGGTSQVRQTLGPGHFFGVRALSQRQPQEASVIATETMTCLVFSAQTPTAFDGRGADMGLSVSGGQKVEYQGVQFTAIHMLDRPLEHLSEHLRRKVAALAAHRTQFAMEATMFPAPVLYALLGAEYFERVALAVGERQFESQLLQASA